MVNTKIGITFDLLIKQTKKQVMKNISEIANMKVSKTSAAQIRMFVYENKATLSQKEIFFCSDVAGIVERNAAKKKSDWSKLTSMSDIMERAANIENYAIAGGASSFQSQII